MKTCAAVILLALPVAMPAQRHNVLLIISDDLNTRIGPYMEMDNHTPNLDRLADEGIRFTRMYCQYPLCGPSRASLMSGLYPEANGVLRNSHTKGSYRAENPSLSGHPTLAGYFRQQGYYTARVSKIFHMGVPGGIEQGGAGGDDPDSWDYAYNVLGPETNSRGALELLSPKNLHYGGNFSRMILEDGLETTQTDFLAASQAIAILENRAGEIQEGATNRVKKKPGAPFFLAVGFVRPHVPLIAPTDCYEPYPEDKVELPPGVVGENVPEAALKRQNDKVWGMNESQQRKTISGYMASVRFMDRQVGRLLDALESLGIRDETIVIFLSDHGYNLGEHNCWSKVSLWEGSVRIPAIISHPGYGEYHGTVFSGVTEMIDLYPTLTGLCGLSEGRPAILQGESLAPVIRGETNGNGRSTAGTGDKGMAGPGKEAMGGTGMAVAYTVTYGGTGATIRTERWRYTRWGEDAVPENEELYDHRNDPEEQVNLAGERRMRKPLRQMRALFESVQSEARMSN